MGSLRRPHLDHLAGAATEQRPSHWRLLRDQPADYARVAVRNDAPPLPKLAVLDVDDVADPHRPVDIRDQPPDFCADDLLGRSWRLAPTRYWHRFPRTTT